MRYCNWVENGTLSEDQDGAAALASTENGSYSLENNQVVSTNAEATYHLVDASEDATTFEVVPSPHFAIDP